MAYRPKIRLYVDAPLDAAGHVTLDKGQGHYLRNVMRSDPGDTVCLFDGQNGEWQGSIEYPNKKIAVIVGLRQVRVQSMEPDLWLVFAPLKKAAQHFQIQKATEMGVSGLLPVKTDFGDVSRFNRDRARATAMEAAEQSGRLTISRIDELCPLDDLLADWPEDRSLLFCDENMMDEPITGPNLDTVNMLEKGAVLIGPAGGFSDAEVERIRALPNTIPVSLGPRILKADTATVVGLALWHMLTN